MRFQSIVPTCLLALLLACQSTDGLRWGERRVPLSDGPELVCRELGRGEEAVVVLGACWMSPDLDRLRDHEHWIYYDLRHRGRSGVASTTNMEEDLRDLEAVLDHFGLARATLVAADYQAAVAARFAASHPGRVERLVLISPLPLRRDPHWSDYQAARNERADHQALQQLRALVQEGGSEVHPEEWATAYKEMILSGVVHDPASLERMRASFVVEPNLDPAPLYRQYMDLVRGLGAWDWRRELGRIKVPTLVVHGLEDAMSTAAHEEWVQAISGARGHGVAESGRLVWIEQPAEFDRVVRPFLGR